MFALQEGGKGQSVRHARPVLLLFVKVYLVNFNVVQVSAVQLHASNKN